ncbi:hypothetical protein [Paraburkholderia sp. HD33-4]|uniref:hypothetical protein n=1 Tax=Paraburkholderia sp. HD33-4 TaxID=2883242 RepID=UPI001F1ACACA|nr:hypothetical protein [Paraburkholderia sp. HD33-4]
MTETTHDSMELTGCDHCWPASAEAAWERPSGLRELDRWVDESHFVVRGLQCFRCSRRFISVFTESIDWTNGDDTQSWTTVPVTADEFAWVGAVVPSSIEAALRVVPSQRRTLRRDHPSGRDAQISWTSGVAVGSHD